MQGTILLIGRDELLLKLRAEILGTAGYEGLIHHVHSDVESGFGCNYHAVLLCHTLTIPEMVRTAKRVRSEAPNAKVVACEKTLESLPESLGADAQINWTDGPETFVATFRKLLEETGG